MKYLAFLIFSIVLLSCVQNIHLKTVTFKVDMTAIEQVENVGVKGSFTPNPWNDILPLSDDNNDGIYEATFSETTAINQIQFKFVNLNVDYELQGLDNRILNFKYQPETIVYEAVFNDPNGKQFIIK